MVNKKNLVMISVLGVVIILLAWLVIAVSGDSIKVTAPVSSTNITGSVLFNVSWNNGTDLNLVGGLTPAEINATFYYNLSGTWTRIGNSSQCSLNACWTNTLSTTSLTDGIFSINATLTNGSATSVSVLFLVNLTNTVTIDNTKPIVFPANITSMINRGNYSGANKAFNVSVVDVTLTVNYVFFNITNASLMTQNESKRGTREGATSSYSILINTTGFVDGTYNVTIWANDTVNNMNNSASITVIFDNTIPQVSPGNISSPASNRNYSGTLSFNVSAFDLTSSIGGVIFNISNASSGVQNATLNASREGTLASYSSSINTASFPDGTYNVTILLNDTAGNNNNSAFVSIVLFDNTIPQVSPANITSMINRGNFSGVNKAFNVSVIDLTAGVGAVYFNITNASLMTQNESKTATREGTTSSYSVLINTTGFADGTYNVTIWANDTAGNNNRSASVTVIFDNTVPQVSPGNITSLINRGNFSGLNKAFNVSVDDLTAGVGAVYFNITNASLMTQNESKTATREGTTSSYSVLINTTGFADGTYNVTIWANDTAGNNNRSASVTVIFDNTIPQANPSGINGTSSATNRSGTIVLNVSVSDLTAGVGHVFFNITNASSNAQNATFTATREGTTNSFSTTVNTAIFPNDKFNITVFSNDTAGNANNSALLTNVIFDNVAPTVGLSCTPNSVSTGGTVTCTCTATDALSGINASYGTSGIVNTANPSTGSTGSYSTSCSSQDTAGNTASAQTSYSVTQSAGGGSSGGGGGGGGETTTWKTFSVNDNQVSSGVTRSLSSSERLKMKVNAEDHYVGVKSVASNSAVMVISSTPQTVTMNAGDNKKFDVSGDGFYDLSVTLNSIKSSKAEITVKSIYEKIPEEPTLQPEVVDNTINEPEVIPTATEQSKGMGALGWTITIILVIVVIAVVIWWYVMKKKR